MGIPVEELNKVGEGSPHVVDRIGAGDVDLVINTPIGRGARADGWEIRRAAVERGVPIITTMSGASAAASAIDAQRAHRPAVQSLQELHRGPRETTPAPSPRPRSGVTQAGQRPGDRDRACRARAGAAGACAVRAPPLPRSANEAIGPYRLVAVEDPEGPIPLPGQFYMLSAVAGWGERAASGLISDAPSRSAGCEAIAWSSWSTRLAPGRGGWRCFARRRGRIPRGSARDRVPAAGGRAGTRRDGRARRRRHRGRTARDPFGGLVASTGQRPTCCSDFAPPITPNPRSSFGPPSLLATDDGSVGHHGLVTDLLEHGDRGQ